MDMTQENKAWWEDTIKNLKVGMICRWLTLVGSIVWAAMFVSFKITTSYDGMISALERHNNRLETIERKQSEQGVSLVVLKSEADDNKKDIAVIQVKCNMRQAQ